MLRPLLVALVALTVACAGAPAADAAITLNAPVTGSAHGWSMALSWTATETPTSSMTVEFRNGGTLIATWIITGGLASSTLNVDRLNPTTDPAVLSGSSVPDGLYTVTISYTTPTASSSSSSAVTLDSVTSAPTMTRPTTSTTYGSTLPITYTLPEAGSSGTISLISGAGTRTFTLNASGLTAGSHPLTLTTAAPTSTAFGSDSGSGPIADGTYEVRLAYRDALDNADASVSRMNVTIDTVTQTPTLTSPASGSTHRGTLDIGFTLPEAPTAGTVTITLTGSVTRVVTLTGGAFGANTLRLDLADPAASAGVASVTGSGPIAEGSSIVTVAYQDAIGNASATSASLVILIAATTTTVPEQQTGSSTATPAAGTTTTAATRGVLLKVRWSGRRTIAAQITPVSGATAYRLTATADTRTRTGTCRLLGRGAKRIARCTLVVGKGAWTLTATALGGGAVLASATRSVR